MPAPRAPARTPTPEVSLEAAVTGDTDSDQTWDLSFPSASANGLPFCRATISDEPGDVVLVHAAPPQLDVTVRDAAGNVMTSCSGLQRTAPGPMTVLRRHGTDIQLQDRWPDDEDLLRVVLLPDGGGRCPHRLVRRGPQRVAVEPRDQQLPMTAPRIPAEPPINAESVDAFVAGASEAALGAAFSLSRRTRASLGVGLR